MMVSEEKHYLLEKISKLESEVQKLLSLNQELLSQNEFLRKKVTELEDKLNIDSSNSGLPTSKEIYKREKSTKPKSDRKIGGQPNHEYQCYKNRTPDKIIEVLPEATVCSCGNELEISEIYTTHQKLEILKIEPYVEEYRLKRKICRNCKKQYKGSLANYRILGTNIQSIITSLGGVFNTSKRDLKSILSQIFNLDISLGLISNSEERVSQKLEERYNNLSEECRSSSHLHIDETGHKNQGKRGWCWSFSNNIISLFKLTNSRGKKVLEEFLPSYDGNIVSDRYAAYNYFDNGNRQICLAHLRRDFKRFAHSNDALLSTFGHTLLNNLDLVFDVYNALKDNKITKLFFFRKIRKLKKRIFKYLRKVRLFSYSKQAQRVAHNILKSFDMMWLFTTNLNIPLSDDF